MQAANLGFPRIGAHRELKFALERFWAGEWDEDQLQSLARELRQVHWKMQEQAGIQHIPSNDFSLYDHVLDTAVMLGAIPARFATPQRSPLETYFAMARGTQSTPAMEMTKWFDTNYHYIVPEFESGMEYHLADDKPLREFLEAKAQGLLTRPVVLGPISFALLGKCSDGRANRLKIAERLLPAYKELFVRLHAAGAAWVQVDEPFLAMDLDSAERRMYALVYDRLVATGNTPRMLLATYFAGISDNLLSAVSLPISALHLDLVRAPEQLPSALQVVPDHMTLSLGVVDGRNIWRTDLDRALGLVNQAVEHLGPERVQVAPSCSLLHVPVNLSEEKELDAELRSWMAFAKQKLEEVSFLARAASENSAEVTNRLAENRRLLQQRRSSPRACNLHVRSGAAAIDESMLRRASNFAERRATQAQAIPLPILPTTTIGSFPQTRAIRQARAAFRSRQLSRREYEQFLAGEIQRVIRLQEEIGLDVLVHGEFERNDMVEYFGEQLEGFAFTRNGWVQSYGSRCVKPPILFGDVARPAAMSVTWSGYAQSLTRSPVKGMLTGPVTMAQWSFVRDDLPREQVCQQLALVLRDEVRDLEAAGIRIIQVDEPALREGLPLRRKERADYLRWAVAAFRLATSAVSDQTQIHTHMCYSEFSEILAAIREMDADVISIEAARSHMSLLHQLSHGDYLNDIGPGVYDVHTPRVPSVAEFECLLRKALRVFRPEQLWVNPDCGLKTRRWEEVQPALKNMLLAARRVRSQLTHQEMPVTSGQAVGTHPYGECGCT